MEKKVFIFPNTNGHQFIWPNELALYEKTGKELRQLEMEILTKSKK